MCPLEQLQSGTRVTEFVTQSVQATPCYVKNRMERPRARSGHLRTLDSVKQGLPTLDNHQTAPQNQTIKITSQSAEAYLKYDIGVNEY